MVDLITDFTQGAPVVSDVIDLSLIDAKTGAGNPGDDDFTFIGVSNFTGVKGQLRESFKDGNTIVSGDVNGDGKADFSFALKGHFLLTAPVISCCSRPRSRQIRPRSSSRPNTKC